MTRLPLHLRAMTIAATSFACIACAQRGTPEIGAFSILDSPAATGSGESHLAVDAAGSLHMTWLERLPDSSVAMRYARRNGETFAETRTITAGRNLFVNWADFPSITVTATGHVLVHWLQRSSAGKYSYDAMLSQSVDRGATWSNPIRLHTDSSASEHGFVSLLPVGDSAMAFWLDGAATHSGQAEGHESGAMQVHTTTIAGDGTRGPEGVIDGRSCDCCQTAAAMTGKGPVVAYRDRSEGEIRDIVVSRLEGSAWSTPSRVHNDDWHIEACPVNGPAIVAVGDTVAVAWFTGARDTAKVQVAYSTDAGTSFGPPVRIDAGNPAGRVAMTFDGRGSVVVAWVERMAGEDAEVRARVVAPDGRMTTPVVITRSSAARASGFPRLARVGDRLYASWTAPGDSARVHMAVAALARP